MRFWSGLAAEPTASLSGGSSLIDSFEDGAKEKGGYLRRGSQLRARRASAQSPSQAVP